MTEIMKPRRRRWVIGVAVAIVLLGGGYAAFVATQSPLILAGVEVEAPTVVAADASGYTVTYTPDGTVILRLHLTNTGRFPAQLDGIVAPWVPTGDSNNMFISTFYRAEPLLYEGESPGPFHSTSVPVDGAVSVGLRLTMCPAGTPGNADARMIMVQINLVYRYAGWRRTHAVDLTQTLSAPAYKCDHTGSRRWG